MRPMGGAKTEQTSRKLRQDDNINFLTLLSTKSTFPLCWGDTDLTTSNQTSLCWECDTTVALSPPSSFCLEPIFELFKAGSRRPPPTSRSSTSKCYIFKLSCVGLIKQVEFHIRNEDESYQASAEMIRLHHDDDDERKQWWPWLQSTNSIDFISSMVLWWEGQRKAKYLFRARGVRGKDPPSFHLNPNPPKGQFRLIINFSNRTPDMKWLWLPSSHIWRDSSLLFMTSQRCVDFYWVRLTCCRVAKNAVFQNDGET